MQLGCSVFNKDVYLKASTLCSNNALLLEKGHNVLYSHLAPRDLNVQVVTLLTYTNLKNADLSNAKLRGAWLMGANLSGAKLDSDTFDIGDYVYIYHTNNDA
jgi:uncharacterized protein YjbI with pentapeptide repeats